MQIPTHMQAAYFESINQISLRTVPVPTPKPGEALVKIMAAGLCITDIHVLQGHFHHADPPYVMGHEISGVVVELAKEQPWPSQVSVGDRVAVETMIACGRCPQCIAGFKNLCEYGGDIGEPPHQGGYCEYISLPVGCLQPIPPNMSFEEAAIFESFVCPVGGLQRLHVEIGDVVLVQGLGPAGIGFVQAAKVMGAGLIIASDPNEKRRNFAAQSGAHICIDPSTQNLKELVMQSTQNKGADICCEASGVEDCLQLSIDLCCKNGKAIFYGIPKDDHQARFDVTQIIIKQLNIHGTSGVPWAWHRSLQLYGAGKFNIKDLVTHRFALQDINEAITTLLSPQADAVKVVLLPHGSPKNKE